MITGERFVVLGLGQARSPWFGELARVANAGAVPLELVKTVTHEEARVRLSSGRAFSALLVDGGLPGVDRDLLDTARRGGVEVLVVDDDRVSRDWLALGATVVLPRDFSVPDLVVALTEVARTIPHGVEDGTPVAPPPRPWSGDLIAVTGAGGAGTSTIAAALAQGLGAEQSRSGAVLLADLALDADQGVLHHAPDIVPGLPELVEAHRGGTLTASAVRSMVFDVEERGYHLLLGMRRRRGWASLRPRAVEAAIDSLLGAYPIVVGDLEPDFDGHDECGSFEVEDRNSIARTALTRARVVVVVGSASIGGLHSLSEVARDVREHGVDPATTVTVVNHAPRSPRERAAIARALLTAPVFVPTRRTVEDATRGGRPLPPTVVNPVTRAVRAAIDPVEIALTEGGGVGPVAVVPGTLGRWVDTEADAI